MKFFSVILLCAGAVFAGSNKDLMNQAEKELRDVNKQVLTKLPKEQIPEHGRVHITARVIDTKPEPLITNLNVKITESKSTTEGK